MGLAEPWCIMGLAINKHKEFFEKPICLQWEKTCIIQLILADLDWDAGR